MRLVHCVARVICNSHGIDRPEVMSTPEDVGAHVAWCYERWAYLQTKPQDDPEVQLELRVLREPKPTPLCIANLRDFNARHDELTYENVKTWYERRRAGEELEKYLRHRSDP